MFFCPDSSRGNDRLVDCVIHKYDDGYLLQVDITCVRRFQQFRIRHEYQEVALSHTQTAPTLSMSALERKKPVVDLRRSYVINIQVGLIITLLGFITAFNVNLDLRPDLDFSEREQEIIEMEEIVQTQQETTPPPPPRPPQPEPVPDDEIMEDLFFDLDTDLDLDAPLDLPPPPPPEEEEEEYEPEIFQVVEDMPEPIGGLDAIYRNIRYPEAARRAGIEGRVIVQFIVDENGNVTNPTILRGIGAGCDEAAIAAIQSVQWTPGRQRGRPVKVQFQVPIMFRLSN